MGSIDINFIISSSWTKKYQVTKKALNQLTPLKPNRRLLKNNQEPMLLTGPKAKKFQIKIQPISKA